jgi:hypothetical protein
MRILRSMGDVLEPLDRDSVPDYETLTSLEYTLADEEERFNHIPSWYDINWTPPHDALPNGYDWRLQARLAVGAKQKRVEVKENHQGEVDKKVATKKTSVMATTTYNSVDNEQAQVAERFISQCEGLAKGKGRRKRKLNIWNPTPAGNKERERIKKVKAANRQGVKERRKVARREREEIKRKELCTVGTK